MPYLNTKPLAHRSLDDKLKLIRIMIFKAYETLDALNTYGDKGIYLFVAPEYFFQASQTKRFYETDERDEFLLELGGIANACRKMVIVPGTFCWRDLKPFLQYKQMPRGKERDKRKSAVLQAIENKQVVYFGYNTAFIFWGEKSGRRPWYAYHKATNVDECLSGDKNTCYYVGAPSDGPGGEKVDTSKFRQGGSLLGAFGVGKLDFGIEVCGDSGSMALVNNLLVGHDSPYMFDVQLLLSQGMDHQFATGALVRYPLRDGGLFVHTDGTEEFEKGNGVFRMARGMGTHGTSSPLKLQVESKEEGELKKIELRDQGYSVMIREEDEEYWVYATDLLARMPSPPGTRGNVNRLTPLNQSLDEMKFWKASIQTVSHTLTMTV